MSDITISIFGMGAVGKSALSLRYVSNIYPEDYDPTIEDTYSVKVKVEDKEQILSIIDTAGQDDFSAMRPTYIRQSNGFVLVYSIDDHASLDQIETLYQEIIRTKETTDVPIVICGNKCDLESKRAISKEEGETMAASFKADFFETSALVDFNVTKMFTKIVEKCYKFIHKNDAIKAPPVITEEQEGKLCSCIIF